MNPSRVCSGHDHVLSGLRTTPMGGFMITVDEIQELRNDFALNRKMLEDLYDRIVQLELHVHYSPGGQGYLDSKAEFEDLKQRDKS